MPQKRHYKNQYQQVFVPYQNICNMRRLLFSLTIISIIFSSCFTGIPRGSSKAVTHEQWTGLLKKYVNEKGLVNYKGFIADSAALNSYLQLLSDNAPAGSWTKEEKLAYWINAYNAFTVKLITQHYPLKSIKDIGPATQIIFVNTPWDKKFFSIGGKSMTLNTIEHKILRKKFKEPRIHFAVNCASISCPKLLNEAYEAATVDAQLTSQAKAFLADTDKNQVTADNPKLSSIFKWFNGDFKKTGLSKVAFINQYAPLKINDAANLDYLDYNWNLNEQQ
jgi:hypothetical protein